MKKSDKKLAIVVIIERQPTTFNSHKSSWITAYTARIKPDGMVEGGVEGFEYLSNHGEDAAMAKVQLRSLLMSDCATRDAYTSSTRPESGNLSNCKPYEIEPVLKALKTVTKKMDTTADKYGIPENFSQCVLHFADAIGANYIITERSTENQIRRTGMGRFSINGVSQGAFNVQQNIRQWFDQYAPLPETANQ